MAQKREKEESELKVPEKLICNTPIPAALPKLSNTDNRSPGISDPSPDKAFHTISSGSDNAMSCSVTSDLISDSPPQQAVAAGSDPKARPKIRGTSGVDERRSCLTTVVETSDLNANPYDSTRQTAATEVSRRLVNRCAGCKRKVGLTGFRCRCGEMFCSEHRYSDRHDCSFDYKAAGREAIRRENPVVRAAKILKV